MITDRKHWRSQISGQRNQPSHTVQQVNFTVLHDHLEGSTQKEKSKQIHPSMNRTERFGVNCRPAIFSNLLQNLKCSSLISHRKVTFDGIFPMKLFCDPIVDNQIPSDVAHCPLKLLFLCGECPVSPAAWSVCTSASWTLQLSLFAPTKATAV